MMRPLLAMGVAVAVLGVIHWFLSASSVPVLPASSTEQIASGTFGIDVLLTFNAGPDPFALSGEDAASLEVAFRGKTIVRRAGPVARGQVASVANVDGVVVGTNEFHVFAVPLDDGENIVHAVRVRVLRDDQPIAEKWLASEPGKPISETISIDVPQLPGHVSFRVTPVFGPRQLIRMVLA